MKNIRLFAVIMAGVVASPWLLASAPHPTVMNVKYKDAFLPVIKVKGDSPVVLVDGKEKTIRSTPIYMGTRGAEFGPERVFVRSAYLSTQEYKTVAGDNAVDDIPTSARMGGAGTRLFEGTVESPKDFRGGFIAVTILAKDALKPGEPFHSPFIMVHDLPDLPAGKPVKISFASPNPGGLVQVMCFVQIFNDHGFEVHSNGLQPAWKYYAMVDRLKLRHAVGMYRKKFAGQDHAAVPFVLIKPDFPENFKPPVNSIMATMKIGATGEVLAVTLDKPYDDITRRTLHDALEGWMFLPELKAGRPVATKVKLPLQF